MIKRNQGAVIAARSYHARNREMRLAVLTHNIGILLMIYLFYRAGGTPAKTSSKAIVLTDYNNFPNQNSDGSLIAITNNKVLNDWKRGNNQMSARHADGADSHVSDQP